MYHRITLVGYLGKGVELRFTPDGTPVANFSVATSQKYNRADGAKVDETIWWRVTVWRKQAENCNQYLKKGSMVLVEGRMKADEKGNPRIFARNDGSAGASFELTADTVRFLGGGNGHSESSSDAPDEVEAPDPVVEEDIPF